VLIARRNRLCISAVFEFPRCVRVKQYGVVFFSCFQEGAKAASLRTRMQRAGSHVLRVKRTLRALCSYSVTQLLNHDVFNEHCELSSRSKYPYYLRSIFMGDRIICQVCACSGGIFSKKELWTNAETAALLACRHARSCEQRRAVAEMSTTYHCSNILSIYRLVLADNRHVCDARGRAVGWRLMNCFDVTA
jgi:hypothetical protein